MARLPLTLPLVLRLALRELRSGLRGFGVFLACLALGVMAIAAVASVSRGLSEGLARDGRLILGGDVAARLVQREADATERAYLARQGRVSSIATLRAMASAGEKGAALVEIKAVDAAYPLVGTLQTRPAGTLKSLLGLKDGHYGAIADPVLLARIGLKTGDLITVGSARIDIRAALVSEPDKIAGGIGFGPRLFLSQEGLRATGLLQPGALVRWAYRVVLPDGQAGSQTLDRFAAGLKAAFPQAGFDVLTRTNAAPQFSKNIERFSQFLTLVGLTALIVGGVGVANAVRGFVARQRPTIATLKSLGAPGGQVVAIYLTQVMLIAGLGIAIGLVLGAAAPFAVAALARPILPIPLVPTLAFGELAAAAAYGGLTAFVFAIAPLGRAHDVPVSGLFRDVVEGARRWPRRRYLIWLVLALGLLVALAVGLAFDRRVAAIYIGAAAGAFVLLRGVAAGLIWTARLLPRPRHAGARLALANIHRPGTLTPSLVLSLGLGVTLIVALTLIDTSLRRQLTQALPDKAPNFFFLDIPGAQADAFADFLTTAQPGGKIERVPMMRGRIVSLNGVPAQKIKAPEKVAWVLEGDRGITYADALPKGSKIAAGAWWPADYRGPPLVSFEDEIAHELGLKVGDDVTVNVLGRNITARIANLRHVEWRSLGINFVMVFAPSAFRGAPHTDLATLRLPNGPDPVAEGALMKAAAQRFPMVTSVRVKDALDAIDAVVAQLALAVRGASAVAVAASLLVLAGGLAAGHQARLYDAVILRTLGATRWRLVGAYALEYGILGAATALFGVMAGTAAAWLIVTRIMNLSFAFDLSGPLMAALLAIFITVTLGLVGTWRILGQKPAASLRTL